MELKRDSGMGHEFCAESPDHAPGSQKLPKTGPRERSVPSLLRTTGVEAVGYSNENPGGYGELMRLTEFLLLEVPNGLSTERAALTEPLAVGCYGVQEARLGQGCWAVGIG